MLEPGRAEVDEPLGEPDRGLVGEAAEHHVCHPARLVGQSSVQLGDGVPVDRGPPRGHRVDQLGPVREPEPDPGRADDLPDRGRVRHRRVGVPDVRAVIGEQGLGITPRDGTHGSRSLGGR